MVSKDLDPENLGFFYFMNYRRIYDQLIDRARKENRQRAKGGVYYEAHHILPKCLEGEGRTSQWKTHPNIVLLTAREHFIAHRLLVKIYPENRKLIFALWAMCNQKKSGREYAVDSRLYEESKIAFITSSPQNTKAFWQTEEGRSVLQKRTAKIDYAAAARKRTANTDWEAKVANTDYKSFQAKRITNTDYTKRKNNPEYSAKRSKVIEQYNKQGILLGVWQSVKAAGEVLGIARSNMSSCLTGKVQSAGGFVWKYRS